MSRAEQRHEINIGAGNAKDVGAALYWLTAAVLALADAVDAGNDDDD